MTNPTNNDTYQHVESLVTGEFNEEQLIELFNSEEYRPYADRIFELAVSEGNKHIAAQSILWWQDAIAQENQPRIEESFNEDMAPERKETDGGGIYLILMTLFLIAYAIKYLTE